MADITIYQTENGTVEVRLEQDTVWLRQEQMSQLFGRERSVITKHLRNVFAEGDWMKKAMCKICTLLARTSRSGFTTSARCWRLVSWRQRCN